jgi:hypothetical protein
VSERHAVWIKPAAAGKTEEVGAALLATLADPVWDHANGTRWTTPTRLAACRAEDQKPPAEQHRSGGLFVGLGGLIMRVRVISDIERLTRMLDEAGRRPVRSLARALTMRSHNARSTSAPTCPSASRCAIAVVGSLEPFMERQQVGGTKKARSHSRVAVPVKAKRLPALGRPGLSAA